MGEECKDIVVADKEFDVEDVVEKKEYKVFNYCKEHPSLLVAVLPIFFALISVILKFCSFLTTKSYVSYFGVDELVPKTTQSFIYLFAIAIIFYVVTIVFQGFISKTFEAYTPYKKRFLLYRYSLRKNKKELKRNKKILKIAKRKVKKLKKNKKAQEELKDIEEKIKTVEEKLVSTSSELKQLEKSVLANRIIYVLIVGMSCLFAGVILFVALYTLLSLGGLAGGNLLIRSGVIVGTYILTYSSINWFTLNVFKIKRKNIKKDAEEKAGFSTYSDFPSMPLERIIKGDIKQWFSDNNCKKILATTLLCFVVFVFASPLSGTKTAEQKTDYFIVCNDNETYAVVYIDDDMLILEKATIMEKRIEIDTTNRMVIEPNGISMQKYSFEEVKVKKPSS